MQTIREAAGSGQEMFWRQPQALRYEFELHASDQALLATLRWQTALGSLALAATAEGRWIFQQTGFWRRAVTVRRADETVAVATFAPHWNGSGTLRLASGRILRWRPGDVWLSRWLWSDDSGAPLLTIGAKRGVLRLAAPVMIAPAAMDVPELDILTTLGWYLLILRSRETVATTPAPV
ncbi:MAG: hypothetical protein ACTHMU_11395 [Thermomicrobiales bacterium]